MIRQLLLLSGLLTVWTLTTSAQEITVRVERPAGWSLASVPVSIEDGTTFRDIFPTFRAAFAYDPEKGYVEMESPSPKIGFWLLLGETSIGSFTGEAFSEYEGEYPAGWSLIGGVSEGPAIVESDPVEALQALFSFGANGYASKDTIDVGHGTWAYCKFPCRLKVKESDDDDDGKEDSTYARASVAAQTQALLLATGEPVENGVSQSRVLIGTNVVGQATPFPPAMPLYSTRIRLFAPGDFNSPLYADLRRNADLNASSYWVLEVDPNGNTDAPRTTTLSWNPDALQTIADGPWTLREGTDDTGPVLIEDMRTTSSLDVTGTAAQHFTISASNDVATDMEDHTGQTPQRYTLSANYPNPFNPSTRIHYDVPEAGHVTLQVYDALGRVVQTLFDGEIGSGSHTATWNGRDHAGRPVTSGVYLYRIEAEGFSETRRMTLLK